MEPSAKRRHLDKSEPLEDYSQFGGKLPETVQVCVFWAASDATPKCRHDGDLESVLIKEFQG